MRKSKHATILALILMVIGSVIVDQVTKHLAHKHLLIWEHQKDPMIYQGKLYPIWTIGNEDRTRGQENFFISFSGNYVRNQGAAWGAFSNLKDSIRIPFFYMVTFFALLVIFFYWRSTPVHHKLARFALALIFSGAIGNFIDRFRFGYVIDFIDVRWHIPLPFPINFSIDFLNISVRLDAWNYHYPNFNWADSAITVGVVLLIFDMIFLEHKRKKFEN